MSERFPDEVLLKAFDKAEAAAGHGNRIRLDPQRIDAAIVAAMRAVLEGHLGQAQPVAVCAWAVDEDGIWTTSCGKEFVFTDDGPTENNFWFCHNCGKRLAITPQAQEPAKRQDYPMALECHCCGDTAVTCDSDGMFYDGQPLECGCLGHVSVDEEEAHVYILDGLCPPHAKCHKPSTGAASDGSPR